MANASNPPVCEDPLQDIEGFSKAMKSPPNSPTFTKFVHILIKKIKVFYKIQKNVEPINEPSKYNFFLIELICCLSDLGCPYIEKIIDHMLSAHQSNYGQLLLVDYLMFKLVTATMIYTNTPAYTRRNGVRPRLSQWPATVADFKKILTQVEELGVPPNLNVNTYLTMLNNDIKITFENERQERLIRNSLREAKLTEVWDKIDRACVRIIAKYKKITELANNPDHHRQK